MKIRSVRFNNHKKVFEVSTPRGSFEFPYAKAEIVPTASDPITEIYIDDEIAREAITYELASGREGTIHVEQFFDYNEEPRYMRDMLLHRLTVEAMDRVKASPLSKREIIRRLGTSPAQFYRLIDPTNYRKSIDKLLMLLQVLDCEVDVVIRKKSA